MVALVREFDLIQGTWQRPMKEVNGYKVIKTSEGYKVVVNVLGISKDDLDISLDVKYLNIKGATKIEEIDFINKVNYQIYIGDFTIDNITYTLKDGFAYINIKVKNENKKVKIQYEG